MNKNIKIKVNNLHVNGIIENSEAKKILILVHGFTGNWNWHKDILLKLSQSIQNLGEYAVLRFNFRGTPHSEGRFRDMTIQTETEDLEEIIKYVKDLGYSDIGILGESMGWTIVTTAYNPLLKIVIYWYPAFDLIDTEFKNLLFDESTQNKLNQDGYISFGKFKIGKSFIDEIPSINVFEKLKKITCPVQLIHGNKDTDVPFWQSEKAFKILNKPKEIQIIDWADHCFENEQDETIQLTIKFIKKYL